MIKTIITFLLVSTTVFAQSLNPGDPKYGKNASPLSKDHEFFKTAEALDFWALIPYYVPQLTDKSCSIATIAMLINAMKKDAPYTQADELATHEGLLSKVKNPLLQNVVGPKAKGIPLVYIKPVIEESLKAYNVQYSKIEMIETETGSSEEAAKLHEILIENEKSADNFLLINFNQGVFTGDISVGHWSPIAAYDEVNKRVLVMDPDRTWFEPYWVSEEVLLKGMGPQSDGANRGYIYIQK